LNPEGGGVGAAYFHESGCGDFFDEIKPRIREWVILGVNITLYDLHQTIDFIDQNRVSIFIRKS
jgi:hypothetical protein